MSSIYEHRLTEINVVRYADKQERRDDGHDDGTTTKTKEMDGRPQGEPAPSTREGPPI
jgi:hypothetical protein